MALMSDCGLLLIYFGTDPSSVKKCMRLVRNQIDGLAQNTLPERSFAKIRDQYCGQLIVGGEMRENRAMAMAKSLLYYDEIHDIAHAAERIRSLTAEDLRMAAEMIAGRGLSSLTLV